MIKSEQIERRRTQRRPIIETFSIFAVIPKKGLHKLEVQDVSESGLGFDLDTEGESSEGFPVQVGDLIDFRLYINRSLYIPLSIRVLRIVNTKAVRRVGAEFQDQTSKSYKAFLSLLHFLDNVTDVIQVDSELVF